MVSKIGVIGQGFVGSAVTEGMKNYFDIISYDKDKSKNSTVDNLEDLIKSIDISFLCLPTPMRKDGSCDVSIVRGCLDDISNICRLLDKEIIIILKSTVPPSTTDSLNLEFNNLHIVFNPEFLTESNAIDDYKNQNRIIIGGDKVSTAIVKQIFVKSFPKIPIIKTSAIIAETIKYVTNSFLAMKVSYANEIYQLCKKMDIDYDKVIEYARYDDRLGNSHWNVPGPDGGFGFGGHCFPGYFTIKTNEGNISLEDAYNDFKKGKNIKCISFDHILENSETKVINNIEKNFYKGELLKFEFENNTYIKCTPEHLFPIERQGKLIIEKAENIIETDVFFNISELIYSRKTMTYDT